MITLDNFIKLCVIRDSYKSKKGMESIKTDAFGPMYMLHVVHLFSKDNMPYFDNCYF